MITPQRAERGSDRRQLARPFGAAAAAAADLRTMISERDVLLAAPPCKGVPQGASQISRCIRAGCDGVRHRHSGLAEPTQLVTRRHLVQQSGVRRIRFHELRHTCASLLLAGCVTPWVMDVLGHAQLSITMDLYSHVLPSALRDAAGAIDRALTEGR